MIEGVYVGGESVVVTPSSVVTTWLTGMLCSCRFLVLPRSSQVR